MITVHTDGGCKKPGGVGAWAYTIDWPDGRYVEASGTEASTTNNRMEMMAVLMALKALPDQEAVIFSDSQYVVKGMTDWIYGWHARNWMTFAGRAGQEPRPLAGDDQRTATCSLVSFRHVKGHNGNPGNEHCDQLCNAGDERLSGRGRRGMKQETVIPWLKMLGATVPTAQLRGGWTVACCPLAHWTHDGGTDKNPAFAVRKERRRRLHPLFRLRLARLAVGAGAGDALPQQARPAGRGQMGRRAPPDRGKRARVRPAARQSRHRGDAVRRQGQEACLPRLVAGDVSAGQPRCRGRATIWPPAR